MDISKGYHIVPPDENRCVWMTAGVLQYQLCDREFRCEECPLDSAIRRQVRSPATVGDSAKTPTVAPRGPILKEGLKYSSNHLWALSLAPRLFRVGLEPGFATAIGRPRAIVLPSPGQPVRAGQVCVWIVTTGGTLAVEAPTGGSVEAANVLLRESPHLLHQDPFDEGWLYEVAADESEIEEACLLPPDRIAETYASDRNRFVTSLAGMLRGHQPGGGLSPAEIEYRLESILDLVDPAKYFSALKQIYT
jgi:glycine cleavage system H protein